MSRNDPPPPPQRDPLARALIVPAAIFGGAILLALIVVLWSGDAEGPATPATEGNQLGAKTLARFESEWDELGVAIGDPDAPVTVREFADYQCPACAAFADTAKRLREEYVASGKVRFIFFDFPLSMHSHSFEAAAAARCAARQDAYWSYHEKLFATQSEWAPKADATGYFLDLAVASGIDVEPFRACLTQGATETMVRASAEVARELGVLSTPTVLVGGQVFSGVTGYQALTAEIETQLANSRGAERGS